MSKASEFPFNGELFLSSNKKYKELVFFVHFYGGSKKKLRRHIQFVNDLGFDAFAFDLYETKISFKLWQVPVSSEGKLGLKHVYSRQIDQLLNQLNQKKIIYSFSNPCASAMESMAKRFCQDCVAMICDSGPSARFVESFDNMAKKDYNLNNWFLRRASMMALTPFWSPHAHQDIHEDLKLFPKGFKVLSIRGWKDHLISAAQIDDVFQPHTQLDWRKLSLPEAGHLNGLRDFASEYSPTVEAFLKEVATPLSSQT